MKESFADYLEKMVCEYIEYSKIEAPKVKIVTPEVSKETSEIEDSVDDAKEILQKAKNLEEEIPKNFTSIAEIVPLPGDWQNAIDAELPQKKIRKKSSKDFVNIPKK